MASTLMSDSSMESELSRHLVLVNLQESPNEKTRKHLEEEVRTAPLFSYLAREIIETQHQQAGDNSQDDDSDDNGSEDSVKGNDSREHRVYPQYGLLGLRTQGIDPQNSKNNLIYANISAPWSSFICGSQGSGKSHTLSCILENALIPSSPAGRLSSPLAGLVVHYDKFTVYGSTQLCEAAYLCSSGIPVRVLVSPTNYIAMKQAYERLPGLGNASGLLKVVPMYLSQKHLNISVIKTLMGVGAGPHQPLYVECIMKILRDMARTNQGREYFDYNAFKWQIENGRFVKGQSQPLQMRLDVLESFFEPGTVAGKHNRKPPKATNDIWEFDSGSLTIIDLSCPFVGPEDACALFNICISLFLKDRAHAGRMIALEEAHKFLTATAPEAQELTGTLLSIIRQQRHLGARVMIATQEPTVSPALLDLCNVTIIHRFTSPAWFQAIKKHIAGATMADESGSQEQDAKSSDQIFHRIVRFKTGEALVFCPTALLDVAGSVGYSSKAGFESGTDSDQVDMQSVTQLGPDIFILKFGRGLLWMVEGVIFRSELLDLLDLLSW